MIRRSRLPALAATAILAALALAPSPSAQAATAPPAIRVAGNQIVNASGAPLRVAGVNRAGSEYACAQGWGFFDGPTDDASIAAISAWGVNAVRLPLNEDCWLGINGVNPAYAGANYQSAVRGYVDRLQAHGLAVILDLHWGAPGSQLALGQEHAPDADHAPAFWSSVAAQYKGVAGIAFDLFNEPHDISWQCWRDGCTTSAGWQAAGTQQLVNAVRGAGATQPLILEGLQWGDDLSGWLANKPSDPANQLVAGWHVYDYSGCNSVSCWDSKVAPVAQQAPILATEIGETDCAGGFLSSLLPWADSHHIGYLAWEWDTSKCTAGPALISDYSGTPTSYGAAYKAHLAAAPLDPAARFDFEDGSTQGWATRWGSTLAVSNETGTSWSGSQGLALDVSGAGYPGAGVDSGLAGVTAGTVVTYRVWAPTGVGTGVSPVVFDENWKAHVLPSRPLAPGWNTITFSVPALGAVRRLGIQVNDDGGWAGRLVLDDVTWQPVVFDFEDSTTQGWSVRWGSTLSLSNESGTAFTGTHGLALDVSGSGYPGAGASAGGSGLVPGVPVTYRVWAPAGASVGVSPMVFDTNWRAYVLPSQPLAPGWNTISFQIPSTLASVGVLGIQVNDGSGWAGRLVLDSVAF